VWTSGGPEPAVLHAAAKLAEGEVSPVVQTDQGVYLVRLTKRAPSHVPPFEEVLEQVRRRVIKDRAKESARARATALYDYFTKQLANGARFEEAAVTYDGTIPVSTFTFTRTGSIGPLGSVRAANEAAFAIPLGSITNVIPASNGFAILRPDVRIPADFSKFADVQEQLRKDTLAKQQSERLNQWLSELRGRARLKSFVDSGSSEG